jgi:hypothetical protein
MSIVPVTDQHKVLLIFVPMLKQITIYGKKKIVNIHNQIYANTINNKKLSYWKEVLQIYLPKINKKSTCSENLIVIQVAWKLNIYIQSITFVKFRCPNILLDLINIICIQRGKALPKWVNCPPVLKV